MYQLNLDAPLKRTSYLITKTTCSSKNQYITFARIVFSLYILYLFSYRPIFGAVSRIPTMALFLSFALILLAEQGHFVKGHRQIFMLALFMCYGLITGNFVAISFDEVITICQTLTYSMVCAYILFSISRHMQGTQWLTRLLLLCMTLLAIYMLMGNAVLVGVGRFSLSEEFNANTLGVLMAFGVWCALREILHVKKKLTGTILYIFIIIIFCYVIILTGSRKSLIGAACISFLWILICLFPYIQQMRGSKKLLLIFTFIVSTVFIWFFFKNIYTQGIFIIFSRMDQLESSVGTWKIGLIMDSLRVFIDYPILGVGLNNYKYHSIYGLYSHCTYTEILACTGIFGSALIYSMFGYTVSGCIKLIRMKTRSSYRIDDLSILILVVFFGIIYFTQILIYNRYLLIEYFILVAQLECSLSQAKQSSEEDKR